MGPGHRASRQKRDRGRLDANKHVAAAASGAWYMSQAWPQAATPSAAPATAPIDLPGTRTSSQAVREKLWIGRMGLKDGFEGQPHTCCGSRMAPIDCLEAPEG
jgi:hypothetical protein